MCRDCGFCGYFGAARAEEPLKLVIGTEGAYPPFNFINPDGSLSGFDVDIARALCDEMKAECTFITQEWDGTIPALQAGKFDAYVSSMSITEERKKQVDFSDKYYNTPPGVAAPKDTDIKGVTKEDLAGKTIGSRRFSRCDDAPDPPARKTARSGETQAWDRGA